MVIKIQALAEDHKHPQEDLGEGIGYICQEISLNDHSIINDHSLINVSLSGFPSSDAGSCRHMKPSKRSLATFYLTCYFISELPAPN